jgi:hypothetical protein
MKLFFLKIIIGLIIALHLKLLYFVSSYQVHFRLLNHFATLHSYVISISIKFKSRVPTLGSFTFTTILLSFWIGRWAIVMVLFTCEVLFWARNSSQLLIFLFIFSIEFPARSLPAKETQKKKQQPKQTSHRRVFKYTLRTSINSLRVKN